MTMRMMMMTDCKDDKLDDSSTAPGLGRLLLIMMMMIAMMLLLLMMMMTILSVCTQYSKTLPYDDFEDGEDKDLCSDNNR